MVRMNTNDQELYPRLAEWLKTDLPQLRTRKPSVWNAFKQYSQLTTTSANGALKWREPTDVHRVCPLLVVADLGERNGEYDTGKPDQISFCDEIAKRFEDDYESETAKEFVESVVLHELVHWGDARDGDIHVGVGELEWGKQFERRAYGRDVERYWLITISPEIPLASASGAIQFNGDDAIGPDGSPFAKKRGPGVITAGKTSLRDFVHGNPDRFAGLSSSVLKVMEAVSLNEGLLEAINTYDKAFLSFGMFQWTVGSNNGKGELAALLARLQAQNMEVFREYFGQYQLGVGSISGSIPRGYLSLEGVSLEQPDQKESMRTLDWAYRFWRAGHDKAVRQVEVEHAASRIDIFQKIKIGGRTGRPISDYITSEHGIALLLDQHVNRPADVQKTVESAVNKMGNVANIVNPGDWTDTQEQQLLNFYVELRNQTAMTDPVGRARKIDESGLVSNKRGSFKR